MLRSLYLATMLVCLSLAASAQPSNVNCQIGPAKETYGGTKWLVYGCDDKTSLLVVTDEGNPAMPSYFLFSQTNDGYELHGEGWGDKKSTDAAYNDLAALADSDITALVAETVIAAKNIEAIPDH